MMDKKQLKQPKEQYIALCISASKECIRRGNYEVTCFLLFLSSEKLATGKEQTQSESVLLDNQSLIRMIKDQTVLKAHCC